MVTSLSLAEARRMALAAQGFDRKRPRRATLRLLRDTVRRLGLLQIDYVNVVCPAHYMVPFSRLGPYDRARFDNLIYRSGEFAEHWAHEISIVPAETWPLLRYRRETDRVRPWGFEKVLEERAAYAAWVLEEVRRRGPLAAADLPPPEGAAGRIPGAWIGTVARGVLEAHFLRGTLAAAGRRSDFSRLYDLAEPLIPAEHRGRRGRTPWARRGTWPTISGCPWPTPSRACASWWKRASCIRLRSRAGARWRISTPKPRRRGASRRPRYFRHSIRSSGAVRAWSACSGSGTGWRFSCRRRSGSTGSMCCHFYWGRNWWHEWI